MSRFRLLLSLVVVLLMSASALADYVIVPVENGGFALPGDGKTRGFDMNQGAAYTASGVLTEVPGWNTNLGAGAVDSGVENPWICDPGPAHDQWNWTADGDSWSAYLMDNDGPIWQTTTHQMKEGEQYLLSFYMGPTGNWGNMPMVGKATLYGVAKNQVTELASLTVDFSALSWWPPNFYWSNYTLGYTATFENEMSGLLLGVMFDNIGNTMTGAPVPGTEGDSWIGVDDVKFIPEPATIALLGLGGLSLVRARKRS